MVKVHATVMLSYRAKYFPHYGDKKYQYHSRLYLQTPRLQVGGEND